MIEKALAQNQGSEVPGQVTLPGLSGLFAYESQKLSNQEETFCWELTLNGHNLTRAYQKAYPTSQPNAARANVHRLIAKESIINRLAQIQDELRRRREAAADAVIDYHNRVLMVDRSDFIGDDGKALPLHELPPLARSIVDVDSSFTKYGSLRLSPKVPERHKSAAELARIQGLYNDKIELGGKVEGDGLGSDIERSARIIAILDAARARAAGHSTEGSNAGLGAAAGAAA